MLVQWGTPGGRVGFVLDSDRQALVSPSLNCGSGEQGSSSRIIKEEMEDYADPGRKHLHSCAPDYVGCTQGTKVVCRFRKGPTMEENLGFETCR